MLSVDEHLKIQIWNVYPISNNVKKTHVMKVLIMNIVRK